MNKDGASGLRRTVVISEPHIYEECAQYGGQQYAKVFSGHGWKVILVSASFNFLRLFVPSSGISDEYIEIWRQRGRRVDVNITNWSFAHPLPASVRYSRLIGRWAHMLYIPNVKRSLHSLGIKKVDLLWLNGNEDWLYRKAITHSKLVMRIIDNYAGFRDGYDNYHPMMRESMMRANAVFACSHYVSRMYSDIRGDITVVPNGVDVERFSGAKKSEPALLSAIPRPRVIYVGAVAAWFDLELVCGLARALPACSFVIVGAWQRPVPTMEECPPNLYILGPQPYDDVPGILAHCDVGLVPFIDSPLVQGVSPIKVYEYLAAALPVVSLRWEELARQQLPIRLAEGAGEFLAAIQEALDTTQEERDKLRDYARHQSWEQRLRTILSKVEMSLDSELS